MNYRTSTFLPIKETDKTFLSYLPLFHEATLYYLFDLFNSSFFCYHVDFVDNFLKFVDFQ